ncbi:HK97 gp10 family phage protein [Methylobacterium sp. JK268]
MDITATFGAIGQGYSALSLAPAAQAFRSAPGVLGALNLVDTIAGVVGVERLTGQLAKYAVKLALRSDRAAEQAAAEMVEAMRARVPQDTGLLLNGITWRKEGRTITVEASALRGAYNYALAVEAGHHAGGHADTDYFAREDHGALRRRPHHETDVPGQPYFWISAREGLAQLRGTMDRAAGDAAQEEGL